MISLNGITIAGVVGVRRFWMAVLIVFCYVFVFPMSARADAGPKPSLKVIVKNPPDREYYLDLLVDYDGEHLYENTKREDVGHPEMYDVLKNYKENGWRPALVTGTKVPLFGSLVGTRNGNVMVHDFSYVGIPDRFKIIIVTKDNDIIVSENAVERKAFRSTAYFDCSTKKLSQDSVALAYITQFVATCLATLIIEGLVLILFRFDTKQNWKPFLMINVFTQLMLTASVFKAMYTSGIIMGLLTYIPLELLIITIEATLFARHLVQHSKRRRIAFAITANVISFALSVMAMFHY